MAKDDTKDPTPPADSLPATPDATAPAPAPVVAPPAPAAPVAPRTYKVTQAQNGTFTNEGHGG